MLHTVLIIYVLAANSTEPAVKYLVNCGRKRRWPDKSEDELVAMIEALVLQADEGELGSLIDSDHPSDEAAMRAALTYIQQWRVVVWARGLNANKGVAPSTSSILERFELGRVGFAESVRPRALGTVAECRARAWARKFRRRWGGSHRRIRIREVVPLGEMREKACKGIVLWLYSALGRFRFAFSGSLGHCGGTEIAAAWRPQNWCRFR